MTNLKHRELVSPCVNSKGVVCTQRNYSKCLDKCLAMDEFRSQLLSIDTSMSATHCEGTGFPIYFHNDGVAYRSAST
jgi:hypothetical protein